MKQRMIVRFCCNPSGAQFGSSLSSRYAGIRKILLQPPAERVRVN